MNTQRGVKQGRYRDFENGAARPDLPPPPPPPRPTKPAEASRSASTTAPPQEYTPAAKTARTPSKARRKAPPRRITPPDAPPSPPDPTDSTQDESDWLGTAAYLTPALKDHVAAAAAAAGVSYGTLILQALEHTWEALQSTPPPNSGGGGMFSGQTRRAKPPGVGQMPLYYRIPRVDAAQIDTMAAQIGTKRSPLIARALHMYLTRDER